MQRRPRTRKPPPMWKSRLRKRTRGLPSRPLPRRIPSAKPARVSKRCAARRMCPRQKPANYWTMVATSCGHSVSTRRARRSSSCFTRARAAGPRWWAWPRSRSSSTNIRRRSIGTRSCPRRGWGRSAGGAGRRLLPLGETHRGAQGLRRRTQAGPENRTARQNLDLVERRSN